MDIFTALPITPLVFLEQQQLPSSHIWAYTIGEGEFIFKMFSIYQNSASTAVLLFNESVSHIFTLSPHN